MCPAETVSCYHSPQYSRLKAKPACCYEKSSKVGRNSLEETILHIPARSVPRLGCSEENPARQPATSPSLPTNRHALLRLCAQLSLSSPS